MKKLKDIYDEYGLTSPSDKNYKPINKKGREIININNNLSFHYSKDTFAKYENINFPSYERQSFSIEKTYYYEAYFSFMIEGIQLPKQTTLIKEENGRALINAYKKLDKTEEIDHNNLFDIIEILSSYEGLIGKASNKKRSYRNDMVGIYEVDGYMQPVLIHEGIDHKLIKESLENLFIIMNKNYEDLSTIITSAIGHVIFEYIHPFFDGNGRVGRMLMFWQLRKSETTFFSSHMSAIINSHRSKYYESLKDSQQTKNLDYFIAYMINVCLESYGIEQTFINLEAKEQLTEKQLAFVRTLIISGINREPVTYPGIKENFKFTHNRDSFNKMINILADNNTINIDKTGKTHKYTLNLIK